MSDSPFRKINEASIGLQAAIQFCARLATHWTYATPERVGVIVTLLDGSTRVIEGAELNRAYAVLDLAVQS
jgi:hypothetical protein